MASHIVLNGVPQLPTPFFSAYVFPHPLFENGHCASKPKQQSFILTLASYESLL